MFSVCVDPNMNFSYREISKHLDPRMYENSGLGKEGF